MTGLLRQNPTITAVLCYNNVVATGAWFGLLRAGRQSGEDGVESYFEQRVALARAIVAAPRVLLFDEPLSNLDSELRESLCGEMSRLLRQLGITALYVTHDRREAELLADQIVYLSAGRVAAVRAVTPTSGEVA